MIPPKIQMIQIEGDGIAAACCARLLTDAGLPCAITRTDRPRRATVLLGNQTQQLLREIFTDAEDLFTGFTPLRRRIVRWGPSAQVVDIPHNGIVAPEEELLRRLWHSVPSLPACSPQSQGWSILTSSEGATHATEVACGSRHANVAAVTLLPGAEQDACWVESVDAGWLFLLATGNRTASLICVGDSTDRALDRSTLIAARLQSRPAAWTRMAAYPRLAQPLAAPNWIACGSAAMAFDPLCGEGIGNAVREAFLAVAVLEAAHTGNAHEPLLGHYNMRLQQGFLRHLQICLQFYSTGGTGHFWDTECQALHQGIVTIKSSLQDSPAPLYRLLDRTLVPINA